MLAAVVAVAASRTPDACASRLLVLRRLVHDILLAATDSGHCDDSCCCVLRRLASLRGIAAVSSSLVHGALAAVATRPVVEPTDDGASMADAISQAWSDTVVLACVGCSGLVQTLWRHFLQVPRRSQRTTDASAVDVVAHQLALRVAQLQAASECGNGRCAIQRQTLCTTVVEQLLTLSDLSVSAGERCAVPAPADAPFLIVECIPCC